MRWVVYLVLLGNAALLYWNLEQRRLVELMPPTVPNSAAITQLILVAELGEEELRRRRDDSPGNTTATTSPAGTKSQSSTFALPTVALACYSVGPLADASTQTSLRSWLQQAGAHVQLREDERRELSRYWVHVLPLASADAANKLLSAMRAKGLVDLHIIRRGNMANAISLGVYRRKSGLDRRMARLQKLGFRAKVQERYRTHKASWFDVVLPATANFDEEQLAAQFSKVESRRRACGVPEDNA